jgi:vesicle-fusing ATPase
MYRVTKFSDEESALKNCVGFSSKSGLKFEYVEIKNPNTKTENTNIFKTMIMNQVNDIDNSQIALHGQHRNQVKVALNDKVYINEVKHIDNNVRVVYFSVSTKFVQNDIEESVFVEKMREILLQQVPTNEMTYNFSFIGIPYIIKIENVSNIGYITNETRFHINYMNNVKVNFIKDLKNNEQEIQLFKKEINIQELGIGGLNDEFLTIFRKAFSSRALPPKIKKELGIIDVRGILLYGPPGCGKTVLARQIGKLLNCVEPKIINGPSLLSKFIGESEQNTRNLFQEAIEDQKQNKNNLHLIIFDEFDALGKKRGLRTSDSGVADQIVNTLLTMIDGVNSLNNILLICMTNRKDLIDEALLRPGRLEVHIEIKLPTEQGRLEILNIHTKSMKESNRLKPDVDLHYIATKTQNYSGAEIEGLVRNATSYAVSREMSLDTLNKKNNEPVNPIVTRSDFERALVEMKPNFGIVNEIYSSILQRINENHNENFSDDKILENINIKTGEVFSILFVGNPKTYKTYLSCHIANKLNFTQIQFISTLNFNFMKNDIVESVEKCKNTDNSCLIFDDLSGLIQWNPIHNTYDNSIFQYIRNSCKTFLNCNQKLCIIANCDDLTFVSLMQLNKIFNKIIQLD